MKILIDEAIPRAEEVFSTIGDVILLPAGDINRRAVRTADALIVRSVTKVTPSLLEGSEVKFVGTATVGVDHIRQSFLKKKGIGLASAPGCSSVAVAEFVINALYALQANKGRPQSQTLGIIGAGRIGLQLKRRAEALGMKCLLNDPPLKETAGNDQLLPLEEVVQNSNIISFHVPLTRSGKHPTFHLVDESVLSKLRSDAIVVNTSRGGVIDEKALLKFRDRFQGLILDVWENEPDIDFQTLRSADIATPHVAGYSWKAKLRATETIYREICDFFNIRDAGSPKSLMGQSDNLEIHLGNENLPGNEFFRKAFSLVYDIEQDDARLRNIVHQSDPGPYFKKLRDSYRFRDEFQGTVIKNHDDLSRRRKLILRKLGFILQ